MRLFVALEIPAEVRQALSGAMARLQDTARGARWVRAEGIHITLKFIGEMADERAGAIGDSLRDVRVDAPVDARIHGLGFFPNERHPRVLWAGVSASPNLVELAEAVAARLEKLGIAGEGREFKPHLTLARFKNEDGLPRLREELGKLEPFEFGALSSNEFHLFRSELLPRGARYTRLETFSFARGNS